MPTRTETVGRFLIDGATSMISSATVVVGDTSNVAIAGAAGMAMPAAKLIDDSVGAGAETFRGIAENFEKLGVVVAFQGIFGSDVDKTDEGLAKQFAAVDADGSGKISTQELRAHIYKVYGKGLDEKILVAFTMYLEALGI